MDDDRIMLALTQRCCVCHAARGEECHDIITGKPLLEAVGRSVHYGRTEL